MRHHDEAVSLARSHWLIISLALATGVTPTAAATTERFDWPLRPRPAVSRGFDRPEQRWNRGHRGVDLVGSIHQRVYAAGAGVVTFSGGIAGRTLVSVQHVGGLRTTYEPVTPLVKAGQRVDQGAVIGTLVAGHHGCAAQACLHWGALRGPASGADYLDPLGLLASTPIRLKPLALATSLAPAT